MSDPQANQAVWQICDFVSASVRQRPAIRCGTYLDTVLRVLDKREAIERDRGQRWGLLFALAGLALSLAELGRALVRQGR